MRPASDGGLSPTPGYYEIRGRAAEIARALGSPVSDAEHLFLGMLHRRGWPVDAISHLVDPGRAEAAVLGILGVPGYSPPPPHRFLGRDGCVRMWGVETAVDMGDSYIGVEHALLDMIRARETVPARALAGLADLDALEAAVLAARNALGSGPPQGAVFLPEGQEMDGPLTRAIVDALPEHATFGFNCTSDGRIWMSVIGPGLATDPEVTREVLTTALASLDRPGPGR